MERRWRSSRLRGKQNCKLGFSRFATRPRPPLIGAGFEGHEKLFELVLVKEDFGFQIRAFRVETVGEIGAELIVSNGADVKPTESCSGVVDPVQESCMGLALGADLSVQIGRARDGAEDRKHFVEVFVGEIL